MSAFLYLSSTSHARRIDLADFGSLFADAEEPQSRIRQPGQGRRIIAACLFLLVAFGDTLLVARPNALAACLDCAERTISAATI